MEKRHYIERQHYVELGVASEFFIEEDSDGVEFGGFTTAASFSTVACWAATLSSASCFSTAGD